MRITLHLDIVELWLHFSSPHSLIQYRKQITSGQEFSLFFKKRAVGLKSKHNTKKPTNKPQQCVVYPCPKKTNKENTHNPVILKYLLKLFFKVPGLKAKLNIAN